MIEQVEELRAELQSPSLRERKLLEHRVVYVPLARSAEHTSPRVPKRSDRGFRKRVPRDVRIQIVFRVSSHRERDSGFNIGEQVRGGSRYQTPADGSSAISIR